MAREDALDKIAHGNTVPALKEGVGGWTIR